MGKWGERQLGGAMTDDQSYGHVAVVFAEIARTLFSARTVGETLQQIVDFAVLTVEVYSRCRAPKPRSLP
jgi:hypothetical protein